MKKNLAVLITSYGVICMFFSLVAGIVAGVSFFTLLLRAFLFFVGGSALIVVIVGLGSILFSDIRWSDGSSNEKSGEINEEASPSRKRRVNVVLDDDFEGDGEDEDNDDNDFTFETSLSEDGIDPTVMSEEGQDTFEEDTLAHEFMDKDKAHTIKPHPLSHETQEHSDLSHEVISYDFRTKHKPLSIDGANEQRASSTTDFSSREPSHLSASLDTLISDNSAFTETHPTPSFPDGNEVFSSDFGDNEFKFDTVESLDITEPPLNEREKNNIDNFEADFLPSSAQSNSRETDAIFSSLEDSVSNTNSNGVRGSKMKKMLTETENESKRNPKKVAQALATWGKKGNNSK